jgi:hypothetical protein
MSLPISSDVLPSGLGAAGTITLVTPCDDNAFTLSWAERLFIALNPVEKVEIDLCMHLSYRSQAKTQLLQVYTSNWRPEDAQERFGAHRLRVRS